MAVELTCESCGRQVGILPSGRALPYRGVVDRQTGERTYRCTDVRSCALAQQRDRRRPTGTLR